MRKYIISIAMALSVMSCKSDDQDFPAIPQKQCDCVFTQMKEEFFQYEIGQPTIITYTDPQIVCGYDTNGWEFVGSNVGNGQPVSDVKVYMKLWRKIECPK